jgi:hypothetical protein
MGNFENKILDEWNNSAKFKIEIGMYDLLPMLQEYLTMKIFKGKRSCEEEDIMLLMTEDVVAFHFGTPESKEHIFDDLGLSIHIPFSEIEMLIENHVAPYIEKITDKKVIGTKVLWDRREKKGFESDNTTIEITLEGDNP